MKKSGFVCPVKDETSSNWLMSSNFKLSHRLIHSRHPAIFALLAGSIFAGISSLQAEDWPHWRGPNFNGISNEKDWNSNWGRQGPETLWKAKVGNGFSSVTTFQGKVFTLGLHGKVEQVVALSEEDGSIVWEFEYPSRFKPMFYEGGVSSTPTVDPETGRVYVLGQTGELFCLKSESGELVWKKDLQAAGGVDPATWGLTGSPLIYGDLLILNAGARGLALRKSDGMDLWSTGAKDNGYATPLPLKFKSQELLAIFSGPGLNLVAPENGKSQYFHAWDTKYGVNAADPLPIGDDKIYISSGYGKGGAMLQLSESGISELWMNKDLRAQFSGPIYMQGVIVGIDGNTTDRATLNCLDPDTGNLLWSEPRIGTGGITAANGILIVLTDRGQLMTGRIDRSKWERISQTQAVGGKCWTTPVLSNGRIYCRNSDGDLVCVDVRNKQN